MNHFKCPIFLSFSNSNSNSNLFQIQKAQKEHDNVKDENNK